MTRAVIYAATLLSILTFTASTRADDWKPIERKLPPKGVKISDADGAKIDARLKVVNDKFSAAQASAGKLSDALSDIGVYIKAVRLARDLDEFYRPQDTAKALSLLDTAERRLDDLGKLEVPWMRATGRVVRGYTSRIDGSFQPYALEIPEGFDFDKPAPLYVWLHGRGDSETDLHFIASREKGGCPISPYVKDGIIVHAFGRQCIGYKSAGEIDVFEAIDSVKSRYKIDPDRVVLMGFSMGGAGCWHLAAHYPDQFVSASPGAGFAETAKYNGLTPDKYPPDYEQKLWGVYDVPDYTRNLFNIALVAYSGEVDKQKQAADVMAAAYKSFYRKLPHVIGPGMGHKYHPDSLKEIMAVMQSAVRKGRDKWPSVVTIQTRTLRYHQVYWVSATGLDEHWVDSRIDARVTDDHTITVETKNIHSLQLTSPWKDKETMPAGTRIVIDGVTLTLADGAKVVDLTEGGKWMFTSQTSPVSQLRKWPGLQGPIDDAFMSSFLAVRPTGKAMSANTGKWVDFEMKHFTDRWQALYRGDAPVKDDMQVTDADIRDNNLILWGDPSSNQVMRKVIDTLPIEWAAGKLTVHGQTVDAATHVPLLIFPNPLNPRKYVVINSGPTHREGHDRTNSLQNPKLGDWALIDITQAPDDLTPGKVVASGFFDEQWRWK